jgi:uncharacterized Zn finger protein (UPF0148 family)
MATATDDAARTDGTYACPDCDEVFDNHRALNAHSAKHKREREGTRFSIKAQVAESLRETIAPLQQQLDEINTQIEAMIRDLTELREARSMLERTLKHLNPTAKPAKGAASTNGAAELASKALDEKIAALRQLIETKPELWADGITANALADYWQAEKIKPAASLQTIRKGFEQLRDEGIMKADRVTKGGGMSWKLVTTNGGHDGT